MAVQVRKKTPVRSRTSGRSICRRMTSPSRVRSVTSSVIPSRASTMRLRRQFAIRNIRWGTPLRGEIDDLVREQHAHRRAREPREGDAGDQRDRQDAHERLERDDDVRVAGDRDHPAVADGRQRLHAEVEGVLERSRAGVRHRTRRRNPVQRREQHVGGHEADRRQQEEARPGPAQHEVVEVLVPGAFDADRLDPPSAPRVRWPPSPTPPTAARPSCRWSAARQRRRRGSARAGSGTVSGHGG